MDDTQKLTELEDLFIIIYNKFKSGDFNESSVLLAKALSIDFTDQKVKEGLKCCEYWKDRVLRYDNLNDPQEKYYYLLKEWRRFIIRFKPRLSDPFEQGVNSIKIWLFTSVLSDMKELISQVEDESNGELLLNLGRAYKGRGDFDKAISTLEAAMKLEKTPPALFAELGDCYAMVNEIKASKIFFREAFYLGAQDVDLVFLESSMIIRLLDKVRELGYDEAVMKEWVPVYGVLLGVFNVKRQLNMLELGELKQKIINLKNDLQESDKDELMTPRLINSYIWLIDHHISNGEKKEVIDDILMNIKMLNENIYHQYIN